MRVRVDLQTAEAERDATGDSVGLEWRGVQRIRPIGLVHRQTLGTPSVLDVGIERNLGLHGGVVGFQRFERGLLVRIVHPGNQLLERVAGDPGHLLDAVLVAQLRLHLAVEDLPGELPGLLQDHAAVLGVGVVAEIRALVDEALALGVDVYAPGIGMLLEAVADREVAGLGRVAVPRYRVAARPVAVRRGADRERHLDRVAGVEARAAHLGELPARAHIARAPFGVGLEAAGRKNHRLRFYLKSFPGFSDHHPMNAIVVRNERNRARLVPVLDAVLLRDLRQRLDQARPAAHRLEREAAPELELAADVEGLPAPGCGEAHAFLAHPHHRGMALLDQDLGEVGIAAVLGEARHVVEELLFGVGAEVGARHFLFGEVDQRPQVVDAVVDDAHQAGGEAGIAAGLFLGGPLEYQHLLCSFLGRERRAQRGIAAANHDDVVVHQSILMWARWITSFQRACSLATKSAYSCGVEPIASASSAL